MSGRIVTNERHRYSANSSGISDYATPKRLLAEEQKVSINYHPHQQLPPTYRHYHNNKSGEAHSHAQQPLHHHLQHYAAPHHQPPHAWWHAVTAFSAPPPATTPLAAGGGGDVAGEEVNAAPATFAAPTTKRGEHF